MVLHTLEHRRIDHIQYVVSHALLATYLQLTVAQAQLEET